MKRFNPMVLGIFLGVGLGAAGCDSETEAELAMEDRGEDGKSDASQSGLDKPCLEMAQSLNACVEQGGGECELEIASWCEDADPPSCCELVSVSGELPTEACNQPMAGQSKQISYCVNRSEFMCRSSCQCTVWLTTPDPTPTDGYENGTLSWEECYDAGGGFVGNYNYGFAGAGTCCGGANQGGHC